MSRHVFLTGAGSGIGRHLTSVLSGGGGRVFATDINEAAMEAAAKADGWSPSVVRHGLDVRSAEQWQRALDAAVAAMGHVDVLLNVAGYLKPGDVGQLDAAEVDRHFDINVKGVVHGTNVVGRYFVQRRAGHVVNVGSLASLAAVPGLALYSSSKFAVRGFSIAAAQELKAHGVALSLVMPDAVQTPMLDLQVDYPQAAMTFSGSRALTVEDIARELTEHVLPDRPLEVTLPRGRGLLARFADAMPGVAMALQPMLARKGRSAQQARKSG